MEHILNSYQIVRVPRLYSQRFADAVVTFADTWTFEVRPRYRLYPHQREKQGKEKIQMKAKSVEKFKIGKVNFHV